MSNRTVVMQIRRPGAGASGSQPPPPRTPSPSAPPTALRAAAPSSSHPLALPMYWASTDILTFAASIGPGTLLPSAYELRGRLEQLFNELNTKAQADGIAREDASEAIYALMALIDELLVQTNWPGRAEWQASPLQLRHFHENSAGENFFRRAQTLLGQPHRAHVLQIYFLCLALGFQGRYSVVGGAGLAAVYDQIASAMSQYVVASDVLSPNGLPPDAGRTLLQREAPIVRLSLVIFGIALVTFIGLRIALSSQLSSATAPMRNYAASTGKP